MRDINRSKAQLLLNAPNLHAHLHAELGIQIGKRLIKEHQVGLDDHRAGKRHALTLTAAHFARIAVFKALQIDEPEHLHDVAANRFLVELAHLQAERHIVKHRHMREKRVALKYKTEVALMQRHVRIVLSVKGNRTLVRLGEARNHAQGRRLTASGGAKQTDEFAALHAQVEIAENDILSVTGSNVFKFEQCHVAFLLTPSG